MTSESPHAERPSVAAPRADATPERRRRRWPLWLAGIIAVLAGAWALAWFVAGAAVTPGTRVLDVEIGGMSRASAVRVLEEQLGPRAGAPMEVAVAGQTVQIDPADAGIRLDAAATVGDSGGRDWRPNRLVAALFADKEVNPVVTVDEARLGAALTAVAARIDKPAREGDVVFTSGKAVAVAPVPGTRLDLEGSAAAVRAAFLRTSDVVTLPTEVVQPTVGAPEVERAMAEFATPAMSAPVTVSAAGRKVVLPPEKLSPAVAMTPDGDGRLQPAVDGALLTDAVVAQDRAFVQTPRDARLAVVKGRPKVVPAKQGRELDQKALAAEVLKVLPSTSDRTATVPMQVTQPKVPTSEITKLGITTKIAEFTQPFPYASYRVTNIGRAGKYISGTVLKPGEQFSLNETVKERTAANGYVKGTVISEGRFREELGGGVSTMTTAMWTAAFYAGMERVEQRGHSFYVSRYTPGLEATVAWGALDLKFRNTSPYGVLITTDVGRDYVTVRMWSTKVYDKIVADIGPRRKVVEHETVYDDKPGCVEQPGEDGFDITVTRLYYKGGKVVKQDSYGTHYNPQAEVICASGP